ncbi:MAG: D-heptose-phosphate adenylyltransferase [Bacteroidetes bacterium]|jgi:rfaE bifunctional protein nucleotidyltransferase chain/domain|nr:D-heptose-phosphate adenylyltransferase [Bacteroidota bacterium]MDF2453856.1 D-heptose-phosphate adenylyltransferase [Bacteroidota bacterium]
MSFHKKLSEKLVAKDQLKTLLEDWKKHDFKIVFTNGCFDILHRGHVEYLCHARDLGDKLVLGLNTDASVKRLGKSPERPINSEDTRATILAALECVDAVILFDEDTPLELITLVQPDVLVKGNDYKAEDIVGYDVVVAKGGKVITIQLVDGFSTTKLIEKMKG